MWEWFNRACRAFGNGVSYVADKVQAGCYSLRDYYCEHPGRVAAGCLVVGGMLLFIPGGVFIDLAVVGAVISVEVLMAASPFIVLGLTALGTWLGKKISARQRENEINEIRRQLEICQNTSNSYQVINRSQVQGLSQSALRSNVLIAQDAQSQQTIQELRVQVVNQGQQIIQLHSELSSTQEQLRVAERLIQAGFFSDRQRVAENNDFPLDNLQEHRETYCA